MLSSVQDQHEGGGWSGERSEGEVWEQFDALPRGVKRLYWYAPYCYTAAPAYDAMLLGVNMRANVERQRAAMDRDVGREALRLYGPSHPQARRRT